jgi:hypothetical protein
MKLMVIDSEGSGEWILIVEDGVLKGMERKAEG